MLIRIVAAVARHGAAPAAVVLGAACGAGVGLLFAAGTAGLLVQGALVASTVVWVRRSSPRALRVARWWLPACTVVPLAVGVTATRAGPAGTVGVVGIVVLAALVVTGRSRRGRPAAVAVAATGPLAAAVVVPVTGPWWVAATASALTGLLATAVALGLAAAGAAPPVRPVASARAVSWRRAAVTGGVAGTAVGAAYVVAELVFPAHVGWTPLTCFVILGAAFASTTTLGTAVRRAVARVGGALGGVVVGTGLVPVLGAGAAATGAAAVVLLCLGAVLRPRGYAWWVGAITAALAVVSTSAGWGFGLERIAAIGAGGALALVAVAGHLALPGPARRRQDGTGPGRAV